MLEKLRNGRNVYGTCITSPAPGWMQVLKNAGLDFAFIDTEHIALDRSEMSKMCYAASTSGLTPIVRIPAPDPYLACQAIDAGAKGVIAPYLETVEQIRDLVGATKFRPLKGRILQEILEGKSAPNAELKAYLDKYNQGNLCIVNIESMPAMEKLDELLSVPGVDGVFIGPHDLSISLGVPEQYDHPEFEKAVKFIIQTTRNKGLSIAIHLSLEPERQVKWIKEGVNIVVHSSDRALFSQKLNTDIQVIRKATGDQPVNERASKEDLPVV
ncbi:MAG: aldolase [Chitinophagaceae bacterium]|nr:aldolase [Chitinophagaceae bacterium]